MARKSITTSHPVLACDVCGRTLLRGERADAFIAGGARRMVCELCTARAANEGWIREGVDDGLVVRRNGGARGRSLLGRLRQRREAGAEDRAAPPARHEAAPAYEPDPVYHSAPAAEPDPARGGETVPGEAAAHDDPYLDQGAWDAEPPAPEPEPEPPARAAPEPAAEPERSRPREPRHVRAVPTNAEMKMSRALNVFNASRHPRTVGGVARSLGAPVVAVRPSATEGSIVSIVVAWELCWYRYEIDLADEDAGVRVMGQGAELGELEPEEQTPNAAADERGALVLAA